MTATKMKRYLSIDSLSREAKRQIERFVIVVECNAYNPNDGDPGMHNDVLWAFLRFVFSTCEHPVYR